MSYTAPILMALAALSAAPAHAAEPVTVFEQAPYKVYREAPGACALEMTYGKGGQIRISHYGGKRIFLSLVRDDYPVLEGKTIRMTYQFDGSNYWMMGGAEPYEEGGRHGFHMEIQDLVLDHWQASRQVTIRIGQTGTPPPETIEITGADKAVKALKRCVKA